jgi:hypothetical protein
VLLTLAVAVPVLAQAQSGMTAERWQRDLEFVEREVPKVHPDAFSRRSRDEFASDLAELRAQLPKLASHQITFALARIVASLQDGHTRLSLPLAPGLEFFLGHAATPPPKDSALLLAALPIRLALLSDGLFVERVDPRYRPVAGARVVGLGQLSADNAVHAVTPFLEHDNEMGVKALVPSRLVLPALLHAAGVTQGPDEVPMAFETRTGHRVELTLRPQSKTEIEWVEGRDSGGAAPPFLRDNTKPYWFEYQHDSKILYLQYNECTDAPSESLKGFTGRLLAQFDRRAARALALDLRNNRGGSNDVNPVLVHALIRHPQLRERGRLFVIVGRNTFSAAMMLAIDLEKHTRAIFVGEPTGARPNHFGDATRLTLPESGMTLRVSTLYWQYSGPRDTRPTLEPHFLAQRASADLWAGGDPALELIERFLSRQPQAPRAAAGSWSGWLGRTAAKMTLTRIDDAWEGHLAAGAEELPMQAIQIDGRRLRFKIPVSARVMAVDAAWFGDVLVGDAEWGSVWLPFVMRRTRNQ